MIILLKSSVAVRHKKRSTIEGHRKVLQIEKNPERDLGIKGQGINNWTKIKALWHHSNVTNARYSELYNSGL